MVSQTASPSPPGRTSTTTTARATGQFQPDCHAFPRSSRGISAGRLDGHRLHSPIHQPAKSPRTANPPTAKTARQTGHRTWLALGPPENEPTPLFAIDDAGLLLVEDPVEGAADLVQVAHRKSPGRLTPYASRAESALTSRLSSTTAWATAAGRTGLCPGGNGKPINRQCGGQIGKI